MSNRNSFIGLDKFVWWVGIVEDRADPLYSGRCKVRIFGWHSQNTSQLPTADLPWAQPMYPINRGTNTFGTPQPDDWIVGFFMDGESGQMPIMMGVLPGIKQ
ncbi:MAG: hypothetical protein ACOYOV_10855 [Bacteroidales bacterium]|jgi:hypothetical protein